MERERGVGATYFFKTAARGPWDVPYAHDSPALQWIVAGLEGVSSGTVEIAGADVTDLPPEKRDIAMITSPRNLD